jgi:hypothetical protein
MIHRRPIVALVICALLAAGPLTPAWGDDDEAAEAALAHGDVRPVHELLQRVGAQFAGSVLKVELEHEDKGDVPWVTR